ncbi:hypothetical protein [Paenibacillus ihumii]|uniref:hypothetical protein n=1 Tax=Paenibacillus ihumii TaxID=687436 RepID=UPI0006D84D27|nr:hypothetical protein [Paenibacillus ihumii]
MVEENKKSIEEALQTIEQEGQAVLNQDSIIKKELIYLAIAFIVSTNAIENLYSSEGIYFAVKASSEESGAGNRHCTTAK